jgi:heat-inducible transcriptional repressor
MDDITPRQMQILKIVIEEYIDTAQPVGSELLDKKYNLGVSPATIRNEMSQLIRTGYLSQPHISAGRVPTPKALRFYVKQLMKEENLSVAEEVSVKERVWDARSQLEDLLREAARVLADKTKCVGLAVTNQNKAYHAGYINLLDEPEFFDIDVTKSVFTLLDETTQLLSILNHVADDDPIHILFGDDLENRHLYPVSIVFSDFSLGQIRGSVGVVGPARLNFSHVIPIVRHITRTIQEISGNYY